MIITCTNLINFSKRGHRWLVEVFLRLHISNFWCNICWSNKNECTDFTAMPTSYFEYQMAWLRNMVCIPMAVRTRIVQWVNGNKRVPLYYLQMEQYNFRKQDIGWPSRYSHVWRLICNRSSTGASFTKIVYPRSKQSKVISYGYRMVVLQRRFNWNSLIWGNGELISESNFVWMLSYMSPNIHVGLTNPC